MFELCRKAFLAISSVLECSRKPLDVIHIVLERCRNVLELCREAFGAISSVSECCRKPLEVIRSVLERCRKVLEVVRSVFEFYTKSKLRVVVSPLLMVAAMVWGCLPSALAVTT